jgi:hypothetical protein|tara:strand:+ start:2742 stop:3143 length:402 start_codon:yes stop_codon:yes gene_type:complete
MGRKPKQYKYVKSNDGRRNNGRKKGVRNIDVLDANSSLRVNKAKRNRATIYTQNAIAKVFGSQEEFFESMAEFAKKGSFNHAKQLMEYGFGKPGESNEDNNNKVNINIKNLFTGNEEQNTIDIDETTESEPKI